MAELTPSRRDLIAGFAFGAVAPAAAGMLLPAAAGAAQPDRSAGAEPISPLNYQPPGRGAVARTMQRKLEDAPLSIADFGAVAQPGSDTGTAFNAAFAQLSGTRNAPPGLPGWGLGAIDVPRGNWRYRTPIAFADSQLGFTLRGAAPFATTHVFDISAGAALPLNVYVGVTLSDFSLKNVAAVPGSSAAIAMQPAGGGGFVAIKRVTLDGFGTGIRLTGTVNGDKTLVEQVLFGTRIGFDQGRNKQAIGWTFANCGGDCRDTHFRLGGAGEVLITNHTSEIYGSLIHYPEGSGNPGSGANHYLGSRTTVASTKLEYHGAGDRMLVDARDSLAPTDGGGSNVDLRLRDVSFASGAARPDPARHTIIQVGNDQAGSDAIRIHQDGGFIEGVIRHGSAQLGALNRRWSFANALAAPDPATVQLLGPGSHPLMEWRANENVPVDQYRGGQAFTGAIDFDKGYLWRHSGPRLIDTGLAGGNNRYGARTGGRFEIAFPAGTAQLGLFVYIDRPIAGTGLEVAQYRDGGYATQVGEVLTLPAGTPKGLYPVHAAMQNLADGRVYLRITLDAGGKEVFGAVVVRYFPYMGS